MSAASQSVIAIDLGFQGVPQVNHVFALANPGGDGVVLVECGPASTRDTLLQGLRHHGIEPRQVTDVLLTHIHLDHGGDAGWWAGRGARIHAHPSAERHLIDPSRLEAGARSLYGDRFDALWGKVRPVPAGQVRTVADGARLFDGRLTAWHSPGHARHHVVWQLGDQLFTGDTAGARLAGRDYVSVTAAPPQFDPAAYDATVARLQQLRPRRLWLTHGGAFDDAAGHLERYRQRVADVAATVGRWLDQGCSADRIRRDYRDRERSLALDSGLDDSQWSVMELMNPTALSADGIMLQWQRERS